MYSAIVPLEKALRKIIGCPAKATKSFAVHAGILKPVKEQGRISYCSRNLSNQVPTSHYLLFFKTIPVDGSRIVFFITVSSTSVPALSLFTRISHLPSGR